MAALFVVLALVLAACGGHSSKGSSSSTPSGSTSATPKQGGTLRYVEVSDNSGGNLDPATQPLWATYGLGQSGNIGQNMYMIYGALLKPNADGVSFSPDIAQSFTSTDGITWTMTLRPNVKFSDGTAFDATAVKAFFDRVMAPATKSPLAARVAGVSSVTVDSPVKLDIALKAKDYSFGAIVARFFSCIPSPTAVAKDPTAFKTAPIGAGPFTVSKYVSGTSMNLVRNPSYWDSPRPYLDGVNVSFLPDFTQAKNAFDASSDMLYSADTATAVSLLDKYQHTSFTDNGGRSVLFNFATAPFNNLLARQAIATALDTTSLQVAIGVRAQDSTPSVFVTTSPFYNSSIKQISYDKSKAQQLLDQYASANGGPLKFELICFQASSAQGEVIQAQLSQYKNINVTLSLVPNLTGAQKLSTGQFTAIMSGPLFYSPYDLLPSLQTGNPNNGGKFSDPKVDKDLTQLTQVPSSDTASQKAIVDDIQKEMVSQLPMFFYTRYSLYEIWKPNVHVDPSTAFADGLLPYDDIWMS